MIKFILPVGLVAFSSLACAQVANTSVDRSLASETEQGTQLPDELNIEQYEQKFWALSDEDWALYQKVKPIAQQLSKTEASPPEVLGIFARTPQERERYAKLFAKRYVQYVDSSVESMRLVRQELRKLHEGRSMFDYAKLNDLRGDKIGVHDRVQFFTKVDCDECHARLAQLINQVRYYKVKLDIFVIDDSTDEQLQKYARAYIPEELAKDGYITLNRDTQFAKKHGIKAPATFISMDGGDLQVHTMK
ncbi:hypothetical protein THMIRHAS_16930 [Thiosulfatimonas sediminis]|uniref:Integrating conjugative element protein n=1 Tax=Thiosulfatimonas sediminis TaxID=2675054 RepID=A0A6F8PWH2_9GAMM|nr:hypothetical protein [Thiosulfatimonas sediminis]BBP46320.1 hypothetical protein THMIRHAS_16930 [Thiosulfatimonas sediminis]